MDILVGGTIHVGSEKYELDYRDKSFRLKFFKFLTIGIIMEGSKLLAFQLNLPHESQVFDWDLDGKNQGYKGWETSV